MHFLLSAKRGDVTSWRAATDFIAAYQQALLASAASDPGGNVETFFMETSASIEAAIKTHHKLLKRFDALSAQLSESPASNINELTCSFYNDLYSHFDVFRSAPVFYRLSTDFLRLASAAIIARATAQAGLTAGQLPEFSLIAAGPAGRCEYSPFRPLQILLVHSEAEASQLKNIDLFCQSLHAEFENAGLAIDPLVTPRNPIWRGPLDEWQNRCEKALRPLAVEESIYLCRLADLSPLQPEDNFFRELKNISSAALNGSRPLLTNLIERMVSLSNGLGLMGRLKLVRSGSASGLFRLLEHGLMPYSVAISALALIKKCAAASNCDRINDLLTRGEVDVEMAERMLLCWHSLHELRLLQERSFDIAERSSLPGGLNPEELTTEQLQSLKGALESVAIIQRHVEIIFSGMGE